MQATLSPIHGPFTLDTLIPTIHGFYKANTQEDVDTLNALLHTEAHHDHTTATENTVIVALSWNLIHCVSPARTLPA